MCLWIKLLYKYELLFYPLSNDIEQKCGWLERLGDMQVSYFEEQIIEKLSTFYAG